jgi:tetratricopeptide (TPR) repeat protein
MALDRLPEAVALARTVRVEASPQLTLAAAAAICLSVAGLPTESEPLVAYVSARSGQFNSQSVGAQATLNSARHDEAANRTLLAALMAQRRAGDYVSPLAIAILHINLEEYDQALDWYGHAVDAHDPAAVFAMPMSFRRHPVIGTHPRFLALLKRMHLPSQAELDAASATAAQPGGAP